MGDQSFPKAIEHVESPRDSAGLPHRRPRMGNVGVDERKYGRATERFKGVDA